MPFGPELRFPARVVDEHEIPAGKFEFRLDESLSPNSEIGWRGGNRIVQGGREQAPQALDGVRVLGRGESSLISEVSDPFAHRIAVEAGARTLGEQRKQGGLEVALPVDDQVVFVRPDLFDRLGNGAVRLRADQRPAPFAVIARDAASYRRVPAGDFPEILVDDPVELDPGTGALGVAQGGQRVDQVAQGRELNEQNSSHLSSKGALSGTR